MTIARSNWKGMSSFSFAKYPNDKYLPKWCMRFNSERNADKEALLLFKTTGWEFSSLNPNHSRECLQQAIGAVALSQYIRKAMGITGWWKTQANSCRASHGSGCRDTQTGAERKGPPWEFRYLKLPLHRAGQSSFPLEMRNQQEFTLCYLEKEGKYALKKDFSATSLSWAYIFRILV